MRKIVPSEDRKMYKLEYSEHTTKINIPCCHKVKNMIADKHKTTKNDDVVVILNLAAIAFEIWCIG